MKQNTHPTDQELLLAADGELSAFQAARIRSHLESCWSCRTRKQDIETSIAEFTHAYLEPWKSVPPDAGPRALLKARMAQARSVRRGLFFTEWRLALAWSTIILIALLGVYRSGWVSRRWSGASEGDEVRAIPRVSLTPGAIRIVSDDEVCGTNKLNGPNAIPDSLKRKIFVEYGIARARTDEFEVDYLVTPELGGAQDIRNLWPQPYRTVAWNAHVKDALEERLHQMVCSGQIDLATAQHDISQDWISAYKKYFHTEKPT